MYTRGSGRFCQPVVVTEEGPEIGADAQRGRQDLVVHRDQRDVAQPRLGRIGDGLAQAPAGAYGFDTEQRA